MRSGLSMPTAARRKSRRARSSPASKVDVTSEQAAPFPLSPSKVKTLERNRIDQLVREIETDAYRWALASAPDPASAEKLLLEAFARLAPSLAATPQVVELKERLRACIRKLGSRRRVSSGLPEERDDRAVAVSESLHVQIVDLLEEQQGVEPVGRRRRVVLGLGGILLVAALAAYLWVRSDALAAAQPTVTALSPLAGAKEGPGRGDFPVALRQRPDGTPSPPLQPPHRVVGAAHWEGSTLVAGYFGLHPA